MLAKLSRRWAEYVAKDHWALVSSVFFLISGLAMLLLYLLVFPQADILLAFVAINAGIAVLMFERAGFIQVLSESSTNDHPTTSVKRQ